MHTSRLRKAMTQTSTDGAARATPSDAVRARVQLDKQENGKVKYRIEHTQNAEALLKSAEQFRHREQAMRRDKTAQMHHFARLSPVQILELREKHKLDILKPMSTSERKRLHYIVQTEYERLMTTDKRLVRRRA